MASAVRSPPARQGPAAAVPGFRPRRPLRVQPPPAGGRRCPPGRVFTTEGGHDWPQWSQLWRKVLDVLPLPSHGKRNAPIRTRLRRGERSQWPSRLDVEGIARRSPVPGRPAGASRRPSRSSRRCRCTDAARDSARARRASRRRHSAARAATRLAPTPPATTSRFRPVASSAASDFFNSTSTIAACVDAARSALRASSSSPSFLRLRQHRGLQAGKGEIEVAAVQQRAAAA